MEELLEVKRKECYSGSASGESSLGKKFCELLFDGIMCWPATKAGIEAKQPCPAYFITQSKGYATRKCELDGKWFVNKETNTTWTNYSTCWVFVDSQTALINIDSNFENSTLYTTWFPILKNISHWGYGISLVTLICSLIIFLSIKKLQCARNRLHMHLFVSFIMRAFMSILKDLIFVEGAFFYSDIIFDNGKQYITENYNWTCKAIISARNYFILANYMLVLMEGIYLHNLMFLKLFSDNNQITLYYILGWGLPLLFIIPWITVRAKFEDTLCWTTPINQYYGLLIEIPIALSVIINFILFAAIVRVLIIKLNLIYIQQRKIKYRRLTRSTLTLVPLFGVPYVISLIISYSATTNKTVEIIWLFFDQTFTAFQGYFVALVYCLMNGEVHREIKHKYNSIRDSHNHFKRTRTISHTVQFQANVSPSQECVYEPS